MKQHLWANVLSNTPLNPEIFKLDLFLPPGSSTPKAGQLYTLKPKGARRGKTLSVAGFTENTLDILTFLVSLEGQGADELARLNNSDSLELTGPLGTSFADFLKPSKEYNNPIALVGGGIGLAPLIALHRENEHNHLGYNFHFYAGFKTDPGFAKEGCYIGSTLKYNPSVITTEDESLGHKGLIQDQLEPKNYSVVIACGPSPMVKAIVEKCSPDTPCLISTEVNTACNASGLVVDALRFARGSGR